MNEIDEIRSNYFEEIKQQKSCLPKRVVRTSTPQPDTAHCYNSLAYGKAIRWDSWKTLPDDMRKHYLEDLYKRFGSVSAAGIGVMMGVSDSTITAELDRLGIERRRAKPSDTRRFFACMNIAQDSIKKPRKKSKNLEVPVVHEKNQATISMDELEAMCKPAEDAIHMDNLEKVYKNVKISCTIDANEIQNIVKALGIKGKVHLAIEEI